MTAADKKILRDLRSEVIRLAKKLDGTSGSSVRRNDRDSLVIGTLGEGEDPRGNRFPQVLKVRLTQTGGSAGTSSAQCSFTYSAFLWSDTGKSEAVATAVAMLGNGQRLVNAQMTAATYGFAIRDTDDAIKLIWADEKFSQTNCAASFASEDTDLSVYVSGAAYSLTATPAVITIGAANAEIIIPGPGDWIITALVNLKYNAATFAANRDVPLKLYRTNNTPTDVAAFPTLTTGIVTTLTSTFQVAYMQTRYTTSASDDIIAIYGSVSVVPSAGSLDAVEASIVLDQV